MTTTAEQTEKDKKAALDARSKDMDRREKELNASKSGKGTRTFLGLTRGRNPQEIQYEQWDESQKDTLPETLSECMDFLKARGVKDNEMEKEVVRRVVLGDNDVLYAEASDPVAEYVDLSWPEDVQKGFRIVVRNYATNANVSIEDAVALIKPGIVASQKKAEPAAV